MGYFQSIYHSRQCTLQVHLFVTADVKLGHKIGIVVVIIIIVVTTLQGN